MPELIPVLDSATIHKKVIAVAEQISADYPEGDLVIVAVLKGAFIFLADLVRNLTISVKIDFLRASSYGNGTQSSGVIKLTHEAEIDLSGKDVLIVEDIIDSGVTLNYLVEHIKSKAPRSLKVCAMIDKLERRQVPLDVDYACHTISEGFLVGYGLDYAEAYRNLPGIYHLKF